MSTAEDVTASASSNANAGLRLTQKTKAGGCASKLPPGALSSVLGRLPRQQHPNLLVGFETSDDAGVYRISERQALVQTVDFFTPMVDDPATFGRVAAANALSDVYAMGGTPISALSLVCFPEDQDLSLLEAILRGGLSMMEEAGCVVLGGHSVKDPEIKFGYAVTGLIEPETVLKNCTARPGDAVVLGKALGTGVITTALKRNLARGAWIEAAIASMTKLNRQASEIVRRFGADVHAVTDVTGFGLAGHAREMALGSGVQLVIETQKIPFLEGAIATAEAGCIPGGLIANRDFAGCFVHDREEGAVPDTIRTLLFDPQTSGGLLISVEADHASALVDELRAAGYDAAQIGSVVEGEPRIVLH